MAYEFSTAQKIVCGAGSLVEAGPIAAKLGRRVLLVAGANTARASHLVEVLRAAALSVTTFQAAGEPIVQVVSDGVSAARESGCDVVIGFGGGSPVDAAKAIAAILGCGGDPPRLPRGRRRGQAAHRRGRTLHRDTHYLRHGRGGHAQTPSSARPNMA